MNKTLRDRISDGVARRLALDEMKGVVASLKTLGCRAFTMLGGEFLLRPDWFGIAAAPSAFGQGAAGTIFAKCGRIPHQP